jgi:hypothetical protein
MSDKGTFIHHPENAGTAAEQATPCDYVDVVRLDDGQPRFLLQPHLHGGAVAMTAFTLEAEGARGLVQHLKAALLDPGAT